MAVCFSINHGTVTALLALAAANLGAELGNLQNALLYGFYTLTALCFAKIIVAQTGYKYGIVAGLATYVVYVASFIIADKEPSAKWPAAIFGGCMGGIAAGFLWTAQGAYFSRNAALYAEAAGISKEQATMSFAGWFALPYLGFEVLFKLLQSYIGVSTGPVSAHWSDGKDFIYVINTIFAVVAMLLCLLIMPMDDPPKEDESKDVDAASSTPSTLQTLIAQAASAMRLFVSDPKMPMMMGMNLSFGVTAAYINSYTTGIVANYFLGRGYGGYLTAVTAGVAAVLSFPLTNLVMIYKACTSSELSKEDVSFFKKGVMVMGPIGFALVCLLPIAVGYNHLGTWSGLIALYALQGVGRGVWEATNKAIFAEYFAYDTVGAFSNLIIQNGGASTVCFFINAYGNVQPTYTDCTCSDPPDYNLQKLPAKDGCSSGSCPAYDGLAWIGVVFSVLSIVGFLGASVLHSKGVRSWSAYDEPSESERALMA